MTEQQLEQLLKREVEKRGGQAWKFTSPGKAGVPDRLILLPGGRAVFVELKAPGGRLQELQKKRAAELQALGFTVHCLDSAAAVQGFIGEVVQK